MSAAVRGLPVAMRRRLSLWRRVRRFAVPRSMVEAVAARWNVGDRPGARAAAGVGVEIDPARLATAYGRAVARQVRSDVANLMPDLLRWHLPRHEGGRGALLPGATGVLRRYGDALLLVVQLPDGPDDPQRVRLSVRPARPARCDFELPPAFWHAACTGELRALCGGTDRIPFFAADATPSRAGCPDDPVGRVERLTLMWDEGRAAEALALCGISVERGPAPDWSTVPLAVDRLVADAQAVVGAGRTGEVALSRWPYGTLTVRIERGGRAVARPANLFNVAGGSGRLPEARWQRPVDFDLVRLGVLAPSELHPLVYKAFFPDADAAGAGPAAPAAPRAVRVRCQGSWHLVRHEGGRLEIPHPPEEIEREDVMRAFGVPPAGCFQARHAWRSGIGRLPLDLRWQRRELFDRAFHGDTAGVLALLDAGFDPAVRAFGGMALPHFLPHLDHRVLLPRLRAAGVDRE